MLDEKIKELEKDSDVIDKLDAHYDFYLLENCFSMPKLLCFLHTSPCFLQNDFLERYDKLVRISLCKVTNVKMDDNQFLQAVVPAAKGSLGVSSARLLALPAFTASAVGAKDALSKIFGLEPMMMRLNGGLNLEKLKWLRKMKSKNIGRSQFFTAKLQT